MGSQKYAGPTGFWPASGWQVIQPSISPHQTKFSAEPGLKLGTMSHIGHLATKPCFKYYSVLFKYNAFNLLQLES